MTNYEAIKIIEIAKAQVEWDLPLDYCVAFDKAIEAIRLSEKVEQYISTLEETKQFETLSKLKIVLGENDENSDDNKDNAS